MLIASGMQEPRKWDKATYRTYVSEATREKLQSSRSSLQLVAPNTQQGNRFANRPKLAQIPALGADAQSREIGAALGNKYRLRP